MPEKAIITKEKKEKVQKLKMQDYEHYTERVFTKINHHINEVNLPYHRHHNTSALLQ